MTKIAIVGYGTMTKGVISQLKRSGDYELFVISRHATQVQGAQVVAAKHLAGSGIDLIMTCFDSAEGAVAFWQAIASRIGDGLDDKWVLDLTTSHPEAVYRVSQQVSQLGAHYIESPMTGSKIGSRTGQLSLFVYCGENWPRVVQTVIQVIAKQVYRFNSLGEATRFKLLYNAWGASLLTSIQQFNPRYYHFDSEDLAVANRIMMTDGWMSLVCSAKLAQVNQGVFEDEHFKLRHLLKDLTYAKAYLSLPNEVVDQIDRLASDYEGHLNKDFSIIGRRPYDL